MTLFTRGAVHPSGYSMMMDDHSLMKISAEGNLIWEKKIASDPLLILKDISFTEGAGFRISAFNFNTSTLSFITVDEEGIIISQLDYPTPSSYGEHHIIGRDSLLVTGQYSSGNDSYGFAALYDISSAQQRWSYTTSITGVTFSVARRISRSSIALLGAQSGSPFSKGCIAAISTAGQEEWLKTYTANTNASITDIIKLQDNTYRALLWRDKASDVLVLANNGEVLGRHALPLAVARALTVDVNDKTIVMAGTSRDRIFLTKFTGTDTFLWWRFFGSGNGSELGDQIRGLFVDNSGISIFGTTRWDSRSRPYLIRTDHNGLTGASLPIHVDVPKKIIELPGHNSGGEPKLLSVEWTGNDFVAGGRTYSYPEDATVPVQSGFVSRFGESGNVTWTKDFLTKSPWGPYVNNSITTIRKTVTGSIVVQETGANNGIYTVDGETISDGFQVFAGKRSDLTELPSRKMLLCYHNFDLQPYNEVGFLAIVDLAQKTMTNIGSRMIGNMIHNIAPSGRGTYIISGEQAETFKVERKAFVAEVNDQGTVLQSHAHNLGYKTYINDMKVLPSGNVVLAGAVENESGERDLLIFITDMNGTIISQKTFDLFNKDEILTIEADADGFLVAGECGRPVFGVQQSFAFVARIDAQMNAAWKKFLGRPGLYAQALRVRRNEDGNIVVVGNAEQWKEGTSSLGGGGFIEVIIEEGEVLGTEKTVSESSVRPNPFGDKLLIDIKTRSAIALYDVHGKVIYQQQEMNAGLFEMNTETLADGLYIVRIKTEDDVEVRKVVRMGR
jgi:hypothetical protein